MGSTQEAPHLPNGLQTIAGWRLVPDAKHEFLTAGLGERKQADQATAGLADNGRCALVDLPTPRTITVDLAQLKGPVTARWFDPTDGRSRLLEGSPFANAGRRGFTPPPTNFAGERDWVLLLAVTP